MDIRGLLSQSCGACQKQKEHLEPSETVWVEDNLNEFREKGYSAVPTLEVECEDEKHVLKGYHTREQIRGVCER